MKKLLQSFVILSVLVCAIAVKTNNIAYSL